MGEIGKFILLGFVYISAWAVCSGSFQGGHRQRLDLLKRDTSRQIHKKQFILPFAQKIYQEPSENLLAGTFDKVTSLGTKAGDNKVLHSEQTVSQAGVLNNNSSKNLKNIDPEIKNKKHYINVKKGFEISDTRGANGTLFASSKHEEISTISNMRFQEAGSRKSRRKNASFINTVTPVDKKHEMRDLSALESKITTNSWMESLSQINSGRYAPISIAKTYLSDFVGKMSLLGRHLTELRGVFDEYVAHKRSRRNIDNHTSYLEANVTEVTKDQTQLFDNELNNSTEIPIKFLVTESSVSVSSNSNDISYKDGSLSTIAPARAGDPEETHPTADKLMTDDTSNYTVHVTGKYGTLLEVEKKDYTDIFMVNKTFEKPDLVQGGDFDPTIFANISDMKNYQTGTVAVNKDVSSVSPLLSESIPPATSSLQISAANTLTDFLTEETATKDPILSGISDNYSLSETVTNFSTVSDPMPDSEESHPVTEDLESGFKIVENETATSRDSNILNEDVQTNTTSSSDAEATQTLVDETFSFQGDYESISPELNVVSTLAPSSVDHSYTLGITLSLGNHSVGHEFEMEIEYFPTVTDDTGAYTNNVSVEITTTRDGSTTAVEAGAGPDWVIAKEAWRYAWEIHIYVFGSLFLIVGLYTMLSFVRLWWIHCLFSSGYFISCHAILMFLCFTRSFYLLYDGYGSNGTRHPSLNHFLYSISLPCLTSAFSVLFYSLLKVTDMQFVAPVLQKLKVVIFINGAHFCVSLATDISIGCFPQFPVLLFVNHVFFIIWGLFLFLGYVCTFPKLHSHAVKHQKNGMYTSASVASAGIISSNETLNAAVKAMFCAGVCGLTIVGLEVYGFVGVYKVFSRGRPGPWTWWLYHTASRLFELLVCLTLSYVASLPLKYRRSEAGCSCGVFCAPCSEIFCCTNKAHNTAEFNHFEQTPIFNPLHSENRDSFAENSSKKLLNQLNFTIPSIDVQHSFSSRPNSLLIIEDGYVRFQTDYDINKIVDSCNDLSQLPSDAHSMSTFLRRDGVVNTGYSLNPRDDTTKSNDFETDNADKSRKSSMTSSDFFRVPSSVSLADSIENELAKAFESFKMESAEVVDEDNKSTDQDVTPNFQNIKEANLVSVASVPETKSSNVLNEQSKQGNLSISNNLLGSKVLSNQPSTLPKKGGSLEMSRTLKETYLLSHPNIQKQSCQNFIGDEMSSFSKHSPNDECLSLLDAEKQENMTLNVEDYDLVVPVSTRRPSEGQGSQAAVLTSLLNSWQSGSNENIDV